MVKAQGAGCRCRVHGEGAGRRVRVQGGDAGHEKSVMSRAGDEGKAGNAARGVRRKGAERQRPGVGVGRGGRRGTLSGQCGAQDVEKGSAEGRKGCGRCGAAAGREGAQGERENVRGGAVGAVHRQGHIGRAISGIHFCRSRHIEKT